MNMRKARFKAIEGEPPIEQADAIIPCFDIFTAFQSSVTTGANFGADDPALVCPDTNGENAFKTNSVLEESSFNVSTDITVIHTFKSRIETVVMANNPTNR